MTANVNNSNLRQSFARYNRYFTKISDNYTTKPHVKSGVEILLSAVLVAFFALFALRPTINTIADLLSQIETQKEIGTQLDKKISDLRVAREVWTREQSNITLLDQALPKKAEPIQFLQLVEGHVAKHDVAIEAITLDDIAIVGDNVSKSTEIKGKAPGTNVIKLSISLRGSYEKLLGFLKDSEELRRVIEVNTVTFGETKESRLSGELSLTITGATSYLRKE